MKLIPHKLGGQQILNDEGVVMHLIPEGQLLTLNKLVAQLVEEYSKLEERVLKLEKKNN